MKKRILSVVTTAAVLTTSFCGVLYTPIVSAESISETLVYNEQLLYQKIDENDDGAYDYIKITGCNYYTERIEIPSEIDDLKVVGVEDFAFGAIKEEVVISVPDTLMTEHIGDNAFMTYEILDYMLIKSTGAETVNEVLRFWFNEIGYNNYTDEQIAEKTAEIILKVGNAEGHSVQEIIVYIIKLIDEFGFSQKSLSLFELILASAPYDSVKLEGNADTEVQKYAATKLNLEYIIAENTLSGDVTFDEIVNLYDVIAIAQYLMDKEMYPLTEEAISVGDVTGDGVLDLYDTIEIAKIIIS